MAAKIIPFEPYHHPCVKGGVLKKLGICSLCERHKRLVAQHVRSGRLRVRMRKGIVKG